MKNISRKRSFVVYWACLCLLAVVLPGTAMADRTIDSGTLDTPATALYEGAKFQVTLQVTTNGSGSADDWDSTLVIFRPSVGPDVTVCLNHFNENGDGTYTKTLQGPAPAAGTYTSLLLEAHNGDSCSDSPSAEFQIATDITVQATPANPDLTEQCNKRVIIVLDESGSIDDTLGATARSLVLSYLAALQNINAEVAIIEFNNYSPLGFNLLGLAAPPYAPARLAIPYTPVTASNITNIFNPYLGPDANITPDTNRYDPEDYPGYPTGYNTYTNWEAAFDEVAAYNSSAGVADLVLFLTDGTPTAWITDDMYITSNALPGFTATAVANAATASLVVEAQGSHIFGIPLDGTSSNLSAITGPDLYDGTNFLIADYTDSASTGDIPADLGTCESSSIPTMNEWGMIVFITLAGLGGVYYLRRQQRAKD